MSLIERSNFCTKNNVFHYSLKTSLNSNISKQKNEQNESKLVAQKMTFSLTLIEFINLFLTLATLTMKNDFVLLFIVVFHFHFLYNLKQQLDKINFSIY